MKNTPKLLFSLLIILSSLSIKGEEPETPIIQAKTDSLVNDWYMQIHALADSSCKGDKYNPFFSDAIYINRLNRLPHLVDMPYNAAVKKQIATYTGPLRKQVAWMLGISPFYFQIFDKIFEREGIPTELKYLAIVESELKADVYAAGGSAGLWQLMPGTAKHLGLEINSLVDERCDPTKSTEAAARYLKSLFLIFNDWNLVIAAYNSGPALVNKAIHRAGGVRDYWKISHLLPPVTQQYVPKYIAATYSMTYHNEHLICPVLTEISNVSDTIMLHHKCDMQEIARITGLPLSRIKKLNPQFRTNIIPAHIKPYHIRLPYKNAYSYIDYKRTQKEQLEKTGSHSKNTATPTKKGNGTKAQTYTVKAGDNLGKIAQKHHVSTSALMKINGLNNKSILSIGDKISIP